MSVFRMKHRRQSLVRQGRYVTHTKKKKKEKKKGKYMHPQKRPEDVTI